jgi:hypothetical protein
VFGPMIVAQFDLSLSLAQSIGFSYGFNLSVSSPQPFHPFILTLTCTQVPANSKVELNMDEISNSSITGL